MNRNAEWEKELRTALLQVHRTIDSSLNSATRDRAVQRVIRGVKFLKRERHTFVARTRKRNFCMLDNQRDVLADTGPSFGVAVRRALTSKQKWYYGFYPAVQYFLKEWNDLYTVLWKTVGRFFRKHQRYDVR